MKRLILSVLSISAFYNFAFAQNAPNNMGQIKGKIAPNLKITPQKPLPPSKAKEPFAGFYNIKGQGSGLCLGTMPKGLGDALFGNFSNGAALEPCNEINTNYALIPRPDGTYTLRQVQATVFANIVPTSLNNCANVARNVVIGPAAIDISKCEYANNYTTPADMGLLDQRFSLVKSSDGLWEIRTHDNECFDARDNGTSSDTEIVKWACNGKPNQKWQLIFDGEIKDEALKQILLNEGLY